MAAGTLMLSSCNKPEKKTRQNLNCNRKYNFRKVPDNLKLEFSGTDNFTIKNAKLKVSLYGVDENLADAPATLITEQEYEQKSVPFTIDFPVPVDAESKINPKPTHGIIYWLSWDSDGNGKLMKKEIYLLITIKHFLM
jgi:uncharacterized protein YcgL (UPF0745 family)